MKLRTAILAMALLAASAADASALTMGQLVARCAQLEVNDIQVSPRSAKPMDLIDAGKCWGHLEAYLDLASSGLGDPKLPNSEHPLGACLRPDVVNLAEMLQMFRAFARAHPNDLQQPAAKMASLMLMEKFPCRGQR